MVRTVNKARRAKKKREILNAAMQCFADKGFHSTSMQDVCRAAGMSPGSLYRYFASKDDIIIAIVEEERQESDEFTSYLANSGDLFGSLSEAIAHVIDRSNEPSYAQLSVEIYAELLRNEKAMEVTVEAYAKATQTLTQALHQAIEKGEVDDGWEPEALAEVIIALIDALETRPPFTRKVSDKTIHETVVKLINSIRTPNP